MKLILLSVILLYVVFSSVLVFRTIENRSMQMQSELSLQYTGQQHKNAQLFMNWMEEMASLVMNSSSVQKSLDEDDKGNTVMSVLDGMISSNLYIQDIIIYGNKGERYASSNVSGIVPLEELSRLPDYQAFLDSPQESQWWVHAPNALAYSTSDPRRRLVYAAKIRAGTSTPAYGGKIRGLLVMSIDLKKLTSFYHTDDPQLYGRHPIYIVTHDRQIVDSGGKLQSPAPGVWDAIRQLPGDPEMEKQSTPEGEVLLYRLHHSRERIAILISGEIIQSELRLLRNILIAVGAFVVILFVFMLQRLSRSILDPLKELYKKMRRPRHF